MTDTALFGTLRLELIRGDITAQPDLDAVVNAANAQLRPGGGVAGAIHRAAGPQLDDACRPFAPINPGEAVTTPAFDLPNTYVIHCLGPVYGKDEPAAKLLSACYGNALDEAEQKACSSVGFPALSTGAFGYPKREAAQIALTAIKESAPNLDTVTLVRFLLFGQEDLEIHRDALTAIR